MRVVVVVVNGEPNASVCVCIKMVVPHFHMCVCEWCGT